MALLITHGYLLTGTGSNLYVNNLVRELVKKGEDVILVCQDFDPLAIDFVNELYDFNSENSIAQLVGKKDSAFKGKCTCFRPNLNGFLPVYVYDHYEGFQVKEFTACSDQEVNSYVQQNYSAMDYILTHHEVEMVNTNHLVMFPYIAKKLKEVHEFKFVITIHGSALNFTVKKDKRFENYAIESLKVAEEIVVDSLHADEEMKEFLEQVGLSYLIKKIEIIPAGVDVNSFGIASLSKSNMLIDFKSSIAENEKNSEGRNSAVSADILYGKYSGSQLNSVVNKTRSSYDYRHIDKDVSKRLDQLDFAENNNVFFVGKYLWTKGIYLLLCGIPTILREKPNTNFIIAGFGPFREPAEVILKYLAENKIDDLIQLVRSNELFLGEGHGDQKAQLPLLEAILVKHQQEMESAISQINFDLRTRVIFTGILNHAQLVHLLPAMDVLIAPSVFPEAFGMVAIEAASCGVYPVVTYQSAFKEIADHVKALVGNKVSNKDVMLNEDASINIAYNVVAYLNQKSQWGESEIATFKQSLRKLVVDNFSWEGIAGKYLINYRR